MRSVYALIPAALLAGTVLSASADAKPRKVELGAYAQRLYAQHKSVRTNIAHGRTVSFAPKAQIRKKIASAKARKLAASKKRVTTNVVVAETKPDIGKKRAAPSVVVADATPDTIKSRVVTNVVVPVKPDPAKKRVAEKIVEPALKLADARPRKLVSKAKIVRIEPAKATTEMALVQKDSAPRKRKLASIASLSATKSLPSAPAQPEKLTEKPVAISPSPAKVKDSGMKPNESTGNYVADIIRELAPSYGVPTWFALRIANVESGYNPYARGRAGEIGVYQLKCQTARGMGFEGDCHGLTDARTNVRWGLKHLSLAIASSDGNLRLAASKHNAGLARKSLVHSYIAKVF